MGTKGNDVWQEKENKMKYYVVMSIVTGSDPVIPEAHGLWNTYSLAKAHAQTLAVYGVLCTIDEVQLLGVGSSMRPY